MAKITSAMWRLAECGGKNIDVIAAVTTWLLETMIITAQWVNSKSLQLYKLLLFLIACALTTGKGEHFAATSVLITLIMFYAVLLVLEEYVYSHTARMLDFANAYCLLTLSIAGVDGLFGLWYLVLWIFINYAVAVFLDAWDQRRGCYI